MAGLRRALRRIALAWLLCQAAMLTLAPLAFAHGDHGAQLECRCTHVDHDICPMHHKPAPGSRACVITSAGGDDVAVFSWLLNAGVMPASPGVLVLERRSAVSRFDGAAVSLRPAPPDPPPPRL